jgi:aminotransferase
MGIELSDRVQAVPPSGIRKFFELAEERDDVISLGVGEPDFATPWRARTAAVDSLERGQTSYTANRGMRELREAIGEHVDAEYDLDYDPDEEILVTAGASEAVDLAFRAFVNPGDTVAVAEPAYVSYAPGVTFAGGEVLGVPTYERDEFRLTRDALEASGAADAEVLVMCFPNNPTGATMELEHLVPVAEFAIEHDLTVVSDEIYAALQYEHEHTSIATLPGMRERTVVVNGFSKAYAMTGLRLGYVMGPSEAVMGMNRIHQYGLLSAPTTAQHAAIEALESCGDAVDEMTSAYDRRRQFLLSRFSEMGVECFRAKGAFYAFPEVPTDQSGSEFAEALLKEEGVAVVPGSVFGDGGEGHLRVSYATGLDELREATDRIERFLD